MKSPKANLRNSVLKSLRAFKSDIGWLVNRWDCTTTVYVPASERTRPSEWKRERQLSEYPEMSAEEWRRLEQWTRSLAQRLYTLAEEAGKHAAESAQEQTDSARRPSVPPG